LSTYSLNNLDRFFLNGTNGFAELLPATGYGPIKGHTNKGELDQPTTIHQTVQMDAFSGILLQGEQPPVPVDGSEAVKDLKIIDAIYQSARTGQRIALKL
jgi:predicted dehydrogenase